MSLNILSYHLGPDLTAIPGNTKIGPLSNLLLDVSHSRQFMAALFCQEESPVIGVWEVHTGGGQH